MTRLVLGLIFTLALTWISTRGEAPKVASVMTMVPSHAPDEDDGSRGTLGSVGEEDDDDDDTSPVAALGREIRSHALLPVPAHVWHAPQTDVIQATLSPPEPPPPRG